jgi:hypothetical protein
MADIDKHYRLKTTKKSIHLRAKNPTEIDTVDSLAEGAMSHCIPSPLRPVVASRLKIEQSKLANSF